MNVLLIDDEKSIRTSTVVTIKAAGHQAHTADNGTVALLKLQQDAYDLVYLDQRLGDEDGLEVRAEAGISTTARHAPGGVVGPQGPNRDRLRSKRR